MTEPTIEDAGLSPNSSVEQFESVLALLLREFKQADPVTYEAFMDEASRGVDRRDSECRTMQTTLA